MACSRPKSPRVSATPSIPKRAPSARCNRCLTKITSRGAPRSEEHTSELQSLMRISYAVFCLKKKTKPQSRQPQQTNLEHSYSPTPHTHTLLHYHDSLSI